MRTAIVAGALGNKPGNGGNAWTRSQWVLGFRRLGFRVLFVEQIAPGACVDEAGAPAAFAASANRRFFRRVADGFALGPSMTLVCGETRETDGMSWNELCDAARAADLLVNISGHLTLEPLKSGPRVKVYYDDDPGFTQFWHAAGDPGPRLEGHDFYYTVGANIGSPGCPIPTGGIAWRGMRPPVVLAEWPVTPPERHDRSTTVASWRGPYGPVTYAGQTYGLKVHEFRKLADLPRLARGVFEIALGIHPADAKDRALLEDRGWRLVDPKAVAGDPWAYRRYVQGSGAECSAAQGVYVQTGSGWFSDRTACYLASGKPAIVQDTGFGGSGEGLIPFRTVEEAAAGAERVVADYARHSRAARAVAEEWFDSDKVLGRLLAEVGVTP